MNDKISIRIFRPGKAISQNIFWGIVLIYFRTINYFSFGIIKFEHAHLLTVMEI